MSSGPDARLLLADPYFELIPLSNLDEQVGFLQRGASVTVTCSPSRGLDHTVDLAVGLARRGFTAAPHLAARQVRDRSHLTAVLARLREAGIGRAFIVAGDADQSGVYPDGLSLIRDMVAEGDGPPSIGIPAYPEGHPFITEQKLWDALLAKQPYAAYLATQLCFDPAAIVGWVREARNRGVTLPVRVGLPAAVGLVKLARIAARIGIGDSMRYLSKQQGLVGGLARSGGFDPDPILGGLADAVAAEPQLGLAGLHIFTFNEIEATRMWLSRH